MQIDLHIFQAIKLKSTWYTSPCRSQAGSGGSALFSKRRRFPFWNRFSIIKTTPTYFKRKRLSSKGGCTISEAAVLAGVLLSTSRKGTFPFSNLTLKYLWVYESNCVAEGPAPETQEMLQALDHVCPGIP